MNTIDTILTTDIQSLESKQSENLLTITLTALRINFSANKSSSSSSLSLPSSSVSSSSKLSSLGKSVTNNNSNNLPEITLQEVAFHDSIDNCWIVLYDRVYDVTEFLDKHPGGEYIILECAGRDATLAFHGTGHSKIALQQLQDYLIGELPKHQRIYRNTNGFLIKLSDIPD